MAASPEAPPLRIASRPSTRNALRGFSPPWQTTHERSRSGLICRAKSTFRLPCGVRTGGGCCATAGRPEAAPTGAAYVKARTAQLVAAAEIHESRWYGKPLLIVGWKGKA